MALANNKPRKVVKDPRISVNKLGEYLEAHPTRRKKIVESAKYPVAYITAMYDRARIIAGKYICGDIDNDGLEAEIDTFEEKADALDKTPENRTKISGYKNSAQALRLLLDNPIKLKGWGLYVYEGKNKYLFTKNVSISVHPDIILKKKTALGVAVGAIKLHIIKTNSLTTESQQVVALMLHQYLEEYVIRPGEYVSKKHCLSHDLFGEEIECCPSSLKTRLQKVEDACVEIAMWWQIV